MRTTADRLRHAIGFEVIGLLICIPLAVWAFGMEVHQLGVLAVGISLAATAWNYGYNRVVDRLMVRHLGRLDKTWGERVAHAAGFELGLLLITLPAAAWWLSVSLWEAFIIDAAMAVFYLVYAFVYNLAYDKAFPVRMAHGA